MKKPSKIIRPTVYDYSTCDDYIKHKYKIETRDYAGKFTQNNYLKNIYATAKALGIARKDLNTQIKDDSTPEAKRMLANRAKVYEEAKKTEPPYQDFWHWIIDECNGVSNGGTILLSEDMAEPGTWEKEILDLFMSEFGEKNADGILEQEFTTSW